jgi:anti-sigma B factor antagonist
MVPEPPDLEIRTNYAGDTATVVITGAIDLATSTTLNRELDAVLDRAPAPMRLRIDLADAGYMDTTGVAVLLKARRRALEQGCRFAVISASPALTRLFEITGLSSLLADG